MPTLALVTDEERRIVELQQGFVDRLRKSAYYLVETTKTDGMLSSAFHICPVLNLEQDLPRYSDKYRPSPASQPNLRRKDLHQPFFPQEIFEDYFTPKRKRKGQCCLTFLSSQNLW